jgi:hypothetical protein
MDPPSIGVAIRIAREWEEQVAQASGRNPGSVRAKAMAFGAALSDALRLGMKRGGIPRNAPAERARSIVAQLLRVLANGPPAETGEVAKTIRSVRRLLQEAALRAATQ